MPQEHVELLTNSSGRIKFAVIAAPMLCGADERLDALGEMYRQMPVEGVAHAFVMGPLFDPHADVNRGRAARFLADRFPQQSGVTTYALRHLGSPRSLYSLGGAMLAAGRNDWVDFAQPVVWLRRDAEARVPLALVYDPEDESFDLARRDLKRLNGAQAPGNSLVAAFGGRRWPRTEWRNAQLLSTVGMFSGTCQGDDPDPVGCMVFDLIIANPTGSIVESSTDFWDLNGTDLRRFGCD